MKKVKHIITDNSGYSLVELIVSMLVMSIIMVMVVMLISTSRRTYNTVNTEAVIQSEAEAVRSFINEIAIEAQQYGQESTIGTEGDSCIWFLSPDNESTDKNKYCYYFILHEAGDNGILRYGKYNCDTSIDSKEIRIKLNDTTTKIVGKDGYSLYDLLESDSTKIKGDDYRLLAEHVKSISFETSAEGLITLNLKLSYNDIEDYTKSFIFAGRNMNR